MRRYVAFLAFSLLLASCAAQPKEVSVEQTQFQLPILTHKPYNPVLRLKVSVAEQATVTLARLNIDLNGTDRPGDIQTVSVLYSGIDSVLSNQVADAATVFGSATVSGHMVAVAGELPLSAGIHYFWISYRMADHSDLSARIASACVSASFKGFEVEPAWSGRRVVQQVGVAVRQHQQDDVHTSRIPGLATTNQGTLLAIFDARYESARDLQGHMDIGLHRSTDGGQTWQPLQIAMDMGEWGGLSQKFNGVSDACILVDKNSDAIYIAGLWMYGVINDEGRWVEGLTDTSTVWNHQWRTKGSQPGFGVKETSQFLIVKSTDDGKTWGEPINLTKMCKRSEWWLWAPAPGNGITMADGTLVFPTQGRDAKGNPFSNITYSKDGGNTWQTSNQALSIPAGTTECAVAQLADGSLMLNMRANKNRGYEGADNGRVIATTTDLGKTWVEHPTSSGALPEPTCMASLYVHTYKHQGENKQMLLFLNPNSKTARDHITLKASFDDGKTWPESHWILLDEWKGRGYSGITSIDEKHIGVVYESSQADLVFQQIAVSQIVDGEPNN